MAQVCEGEQQGDKYITDDCNPERSDSPTGVCEFDWEGANSIRDHKFVSEVFSFRDWNFFKGDEEFRTLADRKAGKRAKAVYRTGRCFDTRREAEAARRRTEINEGSVISIYLGL